MKLIPIIIAACALALVGCDSTPPSPERAVRVEVRLDDRVLPSVHDARIVVLPAGERVLVMTGAEGLATCCLLPPLPAEKAQVRP